MREISLPHGPAHVIAASADESTLLVACDARFDTMDVTTLTLRVEHTLHALGEKITDLALSHDGHRAVVGHSNGYFHVVDYFDGACREIFVKKLLDSPRAVDISSDGMLAACCDYGGNLHVFDVSASTISDRILLNANAHEGRGYDVQFAGGGTEVYSSGRDGLVRS